MNLESQLRLSYYHEIACIDEAHGIRLVQHIESQQIFVLKTETVYDLRVFQYLASHPSPGIPHIEELIEDNGTLYVVEEYISGITLSSLLEQNGPMKEADAIRLVIRLCEILIPFHHLDPPIVHRDIKPDNLIMTYDGRVVLVDFNAAKVSQSEQAQDTVLLGTAGYAAPEQYGFFSSQPTADIYALGVLLNELLTGHLPTEQRSQGPFSGIIDKCLQMDPNNRYQTIDALLYALRHPGHHKVSIPSSVRSWLPPGFRGGRPTTMVFASIWYAFLVILCITMQFTDATPAKALTERLSFFSVFLADTLWLGNYRNCWSVMPLSKSPNRLIRRIGIFLWAFVFFVAILTASVFLLPLAELIYR